MIPRAFVQDLLQRVDVVEIIERYLPLKKGGANYFACCPFHGEKSPSFSVSPDKQFYHCFGCGAHGSAIGFLMEYAGLSFVEAVEELARSVGLVVPREEGALRVPPDAHADLYAALEAAARFYQAQLRESDAAKDYLRGRGLTGELALRYGIGYAPAGWQGLAAAFPHYDHPQLERAGLVIAHENGRRYDRFRERIMFPIHDRRNRVIGFGARILGKGEPKYLNSPETPLFEKGRELYGLPQARAAIRSSGTVIVVEGYMDVVALAQFEISNAVATLGTATTAHHVQQLTRLAQRVVFCFDGDAAGRKAAQRALEAALEHLADDRSIAFLFLPEAHDPDSFVREQGKAAFLSALEAAHPLTEVLLEGLKSGCDLSNPQGRALLTHRAREPLSRIRTPLLRLQLLKEIASAARLEVSEIEAVWDGLPPLPAQSAASTQGEAQGEAQGQTRMAGAIRSSSTGDAQGPAQWRSPSAATQRRPLRRQQGRRRPMDPVETLLRILLQEPAWGARLPPDLIPIENPAGSALVAIVDAIGVGDLAGHEGVGAIVEHFRDSPHAETIAAAIAELDPATFEEGVLELLFRDILGKLHLRQVTVRIESLIARQRADGLDAQGRSLLTELLMEKNRLIRAERSPE